MFLGILPTLPIVFIALCLASIVIPRRVEAELKKFLERNTTIADEKALNEYKSVVRECMHLTLAMMGVICTALFVFAILVWLKGMLAAPLISFLGIAINFSNHKEIGKLEEKARSLTCANRNLQYNYQKISKIWVKNALPNFKVPGDSKLLSQKKLAAAYRAVYAVGVLSIFLGLLATFFRDQVPDGIVLGIGFFVFGALYILLGFFVQRKSIIALGIAVAFMVLNAATGIYNLFQTGSLTGLIIPFIFFAQTWQGFQAIQELKRHT
ncbi:hypothetical protein PN499_18225 [Kamptonema animale CS-326]|jgi:multidrug efflux pump subunit AcrB|uniref:hypothetical protein n=1 Tax=Kamptonema animale TaxID=92934 RepID=UPI00232F6CBA|nr:hypothetical protein [Kamptonema animale]MDB9513133.1 hypothetical protein [Kamptonema animale CS-326]